ncbi:hypothetical protein [Acinetobacter sp. TR11]|uniref:hypothetical protein n=1 Tax=Acinetobacter sp. TR11 TaxID=3003393 RepID=UPI0022ABF2AB|nr:hypothetical protein [Acinetobacter sp. TR11]WAU72723.1 hypothetical protein O1450_11545 [Acinetobacter sp. TR11]
MQIKTKLFSLGLLSLISINSYANLQIYPSKGLFGLNDAHHKCKSLLSSPSEMIESSLSCNFEKAVTPELRAQLQTNFEKALQQAFPNQVVTQIEQNTKNRTYVASLDVVRASEYSVQKQSTTEIFLPLTVSFKLTNILTGEVIFSESKTLVQPIKVVSSDVGQTATDQKIIAQYQANLLILVQQLVESTKSKLKLSEIKATIIDRWKSYLILDKGFDQGISKNDELSSSEGDLIRVVHADRDYAVAIPIMLSGHAKEFSKITSNVRQSIRKPKALVMDVIRFGDEPKELVEQIFSDATGDNAAFTLVPVNRRYSALAQSISEETKLAQAEDINRRELPEFFIRLYVTPVIGYEQKVGQLTQQQFVYSDVMAEMIDSSGRVIHVARANDEIKDVISDGMGFSLENQKEVALKNALIKLAETFKKDLKFTRTDLKVSKSNNQIITIQDQGKQLSIGLKINIYNSQTISARQVLIPIWEATVISRDGNEVTAQLDAPIGKSDQIPVKSGDVIQVDTQQNAIDSNLSRSICTFLPTEQSGDIQFKPFTMMTYYGFAKYSKYPFYAAGVQSEKGRSLKDNIQYMTENAGFKKQLNLKLFEPKTCMQPVFKVNVEPSSLICDANDKNCRVTLDVTTGVRFFNESQQKIGTQGVKQEINLKGFSMQNNKETYLLQLLNDLPPLLQQTVQKADSTQ